MENNPSSLTDISQPAEPPKAASDNLMVFKRTHVYSVLLPLAFVAGLAFGYIFWGRGPTLPTQAAAAVASNPASTANVQAQPTTSADAQKPTRYAISVANRPSTGPDNAPITIVEFSDYECPFCKKFHTETFTPLMEAYKGKIRFVHRNFPLSGIHPDAFPAAEAANCAGEQGVYWAYHDKLLNGPTLGLDVYTQYATDLNLDLTKFKDCIATNRYQSLVQEDYDFAANLGIRSTPTFFINGLAIVGAQPIEVFKQVIDQELSGKIP